MHLPALACGSHPRPVGCLTTPLSLRQTKFLHSRIPFIIVIQHGSQAGRPTAKGAEGGPVLPCVCSGETTHGSHGRLVGQVQCQWLPSLESLFLEARFDQQQPTSPTLPKFEFLPQIPRYMRLAQSMRLSRSRSSVSIFRNGTSYLPLRAPALCPRSRSEYADVTNAKQARGQGSGFESLKGLAINHILE